MTKEKKFICPNCEFENSIPGYCPICDEAYMKKVCECDSGEFASVCCEPELESEERALEEQMEQELSRVVEQEDLEELKEQAFDEDEEEETL